MPFIPRHKFESSREHQNSGFTYILPFKVLLFWKISKGKKKTQLLGCHLKDKINKYQHLLNSGGRDKGSPLFGKEVRWESSQGAWCNSERSGDKGPKDVLKKRTSWKFVLMNLSNNRNFFMLKEDEEDKSIWKMAIETHHLKWATETMKQ